MTASLLIPAVLQFLDGNGNPIPGGTVAYTIPNTNTPKAVWADAAETIPLTNPVPLDAAGIPMSGGSEVQVYGAGNYQMTVRDASGNLQWSGLTSDFASQTGISAAMLPVVQAPTTDDGMLALGISAAMLPVVKAASTGLAVGLLGGPLVSSQVATNYTYSVADRGLVVLRSNAGGLMVDHLPSPTLAQNWFTWIKNVDATAMLVLAADAGAGLAPSLNGWVYIGPGQSMGFFTDGVSYYTLDISGHRARCAAALDVYVATTGSNNNHGLAASAPVLTGAWATRLVYEMFDHNSLIPTIHVADGAYNFGAEGFVAVLSNPVGAGQVTVIGNVASPTSVVLTGVNGPCFSVASCALNVSGCQVNSSGTFITLGGVGVCGFTAGELQIDRIDFGTCSEAHIIGTIGGVVNSSRADSPSNPYSISGPAKYHLASTQAGLVATNGSTVTITGTPAFSVGFAECNECSVIYAPDMTFVGGATGTRYNVSENGTVFVNGGGANYFPGDAPGATSTGGQYN